MRDPIDELDDRTTYVTMMVLAAIVMLAALVTDDARVMAIGCVFVALPVTFALALLRNAWKARSRRRRGYRTVIRGSNCSGYEPTSTRRT